MTIDKEQIKLNKQFWNWWNNGGREKWTEACNSRAGQLNLLGAIEMVFVEGIKTANDNKSKNQTNG